jgi:hypothetical protein
MVGFYDSVNSRIGVNLTAPYYKALSWNNITLADNSYNFNFTVSYGGGAADVDKQIIFANITAPPYATPQTGVTTANSLFANFALVPFVSTSNYYGSSCASPNCGVLLNWINTSTTWGPTQSPPQLRLYTSDSADVKDVQVPNSPANGGAIAYQDVGTAVQDVMSNSGVIVVNPASNSASNQVVVKVPAQKLAVKAYIGSTGAGTTVNGGTYSQIVAITQSIAKLDSEVTTADEQSHDLVLVGGPCVNTLVGALSTASGNATAKFPYTCDSWPARNFGRIQVIDDAFYTGYQVVVVAGTRASDTRLVANVLQQYDTLLSGQTASAVEVTSLSASGITPA